MNFDTKNDKKKELYSLHLTLIDLNLDLSRQGFLVPTPMCRLDYILITP